MNTKEFKNGVLSATIGSLWWGVLGTYFFQYITFAGTLEVVVHRCIWTSLILFITTILLNIKFFQLLAETESGALPIIRILFVFLLI